MSWAAVAGAAVGVVGSAIASDSARSAANKQDGATQGAIDEQARQYDQSRADMAPWIDAGRRALGQYETEINQPFTAADALSDPGYQFGMQQGQQALDRKIAAMGGRVSGAALKAASRFNQGYAGNAFGAAYQRRQDRLNRLASLAQIGQTTTMGSAAAGQQSANAISGLLSSQGDASGAARLYQGNIWGNTANQIGAMFARNRNQPSASQGWNPGANQSWSDDPAGAPYYMGP